MRTARVARRSKSKKPRKQASSAKAGPTLAAGRLKDTLIALEPRILFDAAAVVTGADRAEVDDRARLDYQRLYP